MSRPLIIVGASARAAAGSARRAGYEPWCIDLFADRDLQAVARVRRCPWEDYPLGLLRALREMAPPPAAPVLLTGAMENHPRIVQALALERELLGSGPEAIERVRDPLALASTPPIAGLGCCRTLAPTWGLARRVRGGLARWSWRRYLIKPHHSAGGRHIRFAGERPPIRPGEYLQQFIPGLPISAVLATDGWSVKLLGVTRQIIGDEALGAGRFAYAGSVGPLDTTPQQREALSHLGVSLAQRFDLRGLFGIDLIRDRKGVLWPIEINPRYTASVEVIERATGVASLADWPVEVPQPRKGGGPRIVHGKAYVFTREDCTVPDLYDLFAHDEVADVPAAGAAIAKGRPICTLFAHGDDEAACLERLHEKAGRLYTRLHG